MECCYDFEINGIRGRFEGTEVRSYDDGEFLYFEFDGKQMECEYKRQMLDDIFIKHFLPIYNRKQIYYVLNNTIVKRKISSIGLPYKRPEVFINNGYLYLCAKKVNMKFVGGNAFIAISPAEFENVKCEGLRSRRDHKKYKILKSYRLF